MMPEERLGRPRTAAAKVAQQMDSLLGLPLPPSSDSVHAGRVPCCREEQVYRCSRRRTHDRESSSTHLEDPLDGKLTALHPSRALSLSHVLSVDPVLVLKADSDAGRALRLCGVYSPAPPRIKMTERQRAASTDAYTIGAETRHSNRTFLR